MTSLCWPSIITYFDIPEAGDGTEKVTNDPKKWLSTSHYRYHSLSVFHFLGSVPKVVEKGYHKRQALTMTKLGLSLEELNGQPLELLAREGARLVLSVALEEEVTHFLLFITQRYRVVYPDIK